LLVGFRDIGYLFFLNQRYGATNAVSSFESCYLKKWVEILVLDKWRYLAG